MRTDLTQEWQDYENGVQYNTKVDYYHKTDLHWRFYNGRHWDGIKANGLPTPVFNISRAAINYMIASIMSQKIKMQYSAENIPDEPQPGTIEAQIKEFVDLMSGAVELKWEKEKMDSKLRQCLLDGGNTGDFCAYTYWDPIKETGQDEKGDFTTELIDGVNVLFGNPNCADVEKQPYIILVFRELVKKLKEEAKDNGISQDLIDTIQPDQENTYQAGEHGKIELDVQGDDGKCIAVMKFWKQDGEVLWKKSTKFCPIIKERKVGRPKGELTDETKFTRYPIAFGNWEKVKNSYHGMAVMAGIIPNQIIINQLFAMVAYWMRMQAFGKVVYDGNRIASWSSTLGTAIKADGDIRDAVFQLQSGNFNAGVMQVIDLAIKYTKDFVGASDAALGQVQPENTSAIIAVQKAAAIPLENIQANLYQFVEDIGLIWGEFMLKKYGNRTISYRSSGKMLTTQFDSSQGQNILLNCSVDVGPSSYWSEVISMQTLDNLLKAQQINMLQYLERIPNGIVPKKQELIDELKAAQEQAQAIQAQQDQYERMAQWLESQPPEIQAQINQLPTAQKEQAIQTMMQQQQGGVQGGQMPQM